VQLARGLTSGCEVSAVPDRYPHGGEADILTIENKAHNKIDEVGGKLKEVVGKFTGDESAENEGKFEQMKANLKDAGEKVKDAFKE